LARSKVPSCTVPLVCAVINDGDVVCVVQVKPAAGIEYRLTILPGRRRVHPIPWALIVEDNGKVMSVGPDVAVEYNAPSAGERVGHASYG